MLYQLNRTAKGRRGNESQIPGSTDYNDGDEQRECAYSSAKQPCYQSKWEMQHGKYTYDGG